MSMLWRRVVLILLSAIFLPFAHAQQSTVLFSEAGFPTADSSPVAVESLHAGLVDARIVDAAQLAPALSDETTRLLVMPYGSAYPEAAWPAVLRFLDRGGNLIVLGGKPFTRAAYRDGSGWKLREPSVAASLEIFIHDYQETPGSEGLQFEANTDVQPTVPAFQWKRAFSPVLRLSVTARNPGEMGSTGNEDAFLTTLAWGLKDGHRVAAPLFLIDHVAERFVGGRWIFAACDGDARAFADPKLIGVLQTLALRRNDRFTFRPRVALFLPGEALEFRFQPAPGNSAEAGDRLRITAQIENGPAQQLEFAAEAGKVTTLPASLAEGPGLRTVEATLVRNGAALWTYRTGFWMRNRAYLTTGPRLSVGADYFALDGQPLPVVGTTYMASDVNRMYLAQPNPYVWDQDMKQIRGAGLNMLRSGIWSGWKLLVNPDDSMSEEALRSVEAFLMTARRYGLPVQFNLFAFVPDAFGGSHAYLDPVARERQDRYVSSVVRRFHDVPFLAWDLINEPSANHNAWKTMPQKEEDAAWRAWIRQRYPDEAALLAAWAEPSVGIGRALQSHPTATPPEKAAADPLALPDAGAFGEDAVRGGYNPLKLYDYNLFTQSVFRDWVQHQDATIRAAGSEQLITVGQDEGGVAGRLSPAFFSPDVSFTATHTWWDFDSILWAGLMAKMPGKPMLVQEMGEQRRLTQDDHLRLSAEAEAWQLERKLAISFAQGAGGIEWVWNVNATMANDNEIPIGAVRPDGTEKPEVPVLSGMAQFARKHPQSFTAIEPPPVTMIVSQAQLYTGMWSPAVEKEKKAVRALAYVDHAPLRLLPENRVAELGHPKLVILPSAQALTQGAWERLLDYVANGGCLLVTGPVDYDEHWQRVDRLSPLHVNAAIQPLAIRQSVLKLPGEQQAIQVSYSSEVQTAPTDILRFADGASLKTIHHGSGTILWAADPVEFAEGYQATAALYQYALKIAGIAAPFVERKPLSPGVLAFRTMMKDAILYSFSSECFDEQVVDIEDSTTHARLHFTLPAQRAALMLLDRKTGAVLASYLPGNTPRASSSVETSASGRPTTLK